MKKIRDIFTKVENRAKRLKKDPDKHGAAQIVLDYIEEQRGKRRKLE